MGAEREWCNHVRRDRSFVGGFKVLICEETNEHHSVEKWKFCPVCGTPRPEEKKSLVERLKQAKTRHLALGMGSCTEDSDCIMKVYAKETISAVIEEIEKEKEYNNPFAVQSLNRLKERLNALAG